MTEADIYPLVKALAGGRVFPYVVPLNAKDEPAVDPPWVVFSLISHSLADVLCGTAEEKNALQVDVYSKTLAQARTIRNEVLAALSPLGLTDRQLLQDYDSTSGLFRATIDAQIID
ncbi:DUF3168 domain-containing protein [Leminorella grimontii]|uniref:DUF3168 domain-containing protein n=1 Tax=Leminorella grimontii TaxID=82981 RepID=UPI002081B6BC|nr:DUF3168 domain-containing protein [Leminorella grimontii]GKX58346.1 hypothetical protein SOASR031_06610 [Leminorella grimontii]